MLARNDKEVNVDKHQHPHLTIVPDYPARVEIDNRRLEEKREQTRRNMSKIVQLWATAAYQAAHTEQTEDTIA